MKILITGISGLLGTELAKRLSDEHEVVGLARTGVLSGFVVYNADITDHDGMYKLISRVNPDMVIHTATMTNVDDCEETPDQAYAVNALGTRNVAVACQRFDTAMMYISTDYAFSGQNPPRDGYKEYDREEPISHYAKSKLAGEWYVRHLLNKFFIVRTAWLFGRARDNFISRTAGALIANKQVKAVEDMVSTPTNVKDLSDAIARLIATSRFGLYHITNGGFASRYDVVCEIADMLSAPRTLVKRVVLDDLDLPAARPRFSALNNFVWQLEGFPPMRPWKDAIREFLHESGYIK